MQRTCVGCCVVFVIVADMILMTFAAGPAWTTPSTSTITVDSTTLGVCDDVTSLNALSTDGSRVAYSIQSQTPDGGFSIVQNMATFVDHLTCTVGSINAESYRVVVSARHDRGNNEESLLSLTIIFSNLAPVAPVFVIPNPDKTKPDHTIYINETIQAGDVVLQLSATDKDTDDATLTFSMVTSPESTRQLFEIDNANKELKIKNGVAPDYFDVDKVDAIRNYSIDFVVRDGELSTNLSTTISVTDVNDNPPVFSGNYTVDILESAIAAFSPGETVLTVSVTDIDKTSVNNKVSLSLEGTSNFELRGYKLIIADGAVFNAGSTNYMNITASDNAPTDSKYTVQLVTINVKTVAGNEPSGDSKGPTNGCKIGVDVGLSFGGLAFLVTVSFCLKRTDY